VKGLDDVDGRFGDQVLDYGQPAIHVNGHQFAVFVQQFRLLRVHGHKVLFEKIRIHQNTIDIVAAKGNGCGRFSGNVVQRFSAFANGPGNSRGSVEVILYISGIYNWAF